MLMAKDPAIEYGNMSGFISFGMKYETQMSAKNAPYKVPVVAMKPLNCLETSLSVSVSKLATMSVMNIQLKNPNNVM